MVVKWAAANVIYLFKVQKYVGEGARMVRELFEMARTKKACLVR
jgi:ATP-dependent 26S proteasome regulatory subunit